MLITGATGGIGTAVARAAAESGYRVMVAGRDADRLAQLYATNPGTSPVLLDLRNLANCPSTWPNLTASTRSCIARG